MRRRTDEELMQRYAETEDHGAFREIYGRYAARLSRMIGRHVYRDADAQDVLQQTFMQLHRSRRDYHASRQLRPWIYTIAMNLCRDHARRKRRRPEVSAPLDRFASEDPTPGARESQDRRRSVQAALETLPRTSRRILEMHYYEDRRMCDIATELGMKATTVRVRAHRACRDLRSVLANSGAG